MIKFLTLDDIKQIKIKPVLFGWLVANGLILAIFIPIFISVFFFTFNSSATKADEFLKRYFENTAFNLIISVIPGIIGGYVAANNADRLKITHAFGLGLLFILQGVIFNLIPKFRTPYDLESVLYLISEIPIAMLGGFLKIRVDAFKEGRRRVQD